MQCTPPTKDIFKPEPNDVAFPNTDFAPVIRLTFLTDFIKRDAARVCRL